MPSTVTNMPVASQAVSHVGRKSNKARAASNKRAARVMQVHERWQRHLGTGSQTLRVALKTGVIDDRGQAKSLSRIPKQSSNMVREPEYPSIEYAPEYWLGLVARGMRFNPAPWEVNQSTVKYREYSEKLGHVITKSKTVYHGGMRQKSIPKLLWRGEPCLFDWCMLGEDRSTMGNGKRVEYHQLIGTLPPFPEHRACKPRSLELEAMLADWKGRQQLAYLEGLGVSL